MMWEEREKEKCDRRRGGTRRSGVEIEERGENAWVKERTVAAIAFGTIYMECYSGGLFGSIGKQMEQINFQYWLKN
jgi:hypothetical protein